MGRQIMLGLLKGCRLGSNLHKLCVCCSWNTTRGGNQCAQLSNIQAVHMPSPPDHEGPVAQNGGFLCSFNHHLRAMETVREDNGIGKKIPGFGYWSNQSTPTDCHVRCNGADTDCYLKLSITTTSEPTSTTRTDAWSRRLPKTLACMTELAFEYSSGYASSVSQMRRACLGVLFQRRRYPLWIERRSLSYAQSNEFARTIEAERLKSAAGARMEFEMSALLSESKDEDFDFRNFPALTSSFFQDYARPSGMESKTRVVWLNRRNQSDADSKLTLESVPQPKGRPYNFGLGDIPSKPPPLEVGARPQGGFDIDISMEDYKGVHPVRESKLGAVPQSQTRGKLPWNTVGADNCSEMSKDPQHSVSQGDDQEVGWNPQEFGESVVLHRAETEEQ